MSTSPNPFLRVLAQIWRVLLWVVLSLSGIVALAFITLTASVFSPLLGPVLVILFPAAIMAVVYFFMRRTRLLAGDHKIVKRQRTIYGLTLFGSAFIVQGVAIYLARQGLSAPLVASVSLATFLMTYLIVNMLPVGQAAAQSVAADWEEHPSQRKVALTILAASLAGCALLLREVRSFDDFVKGGVLLTALLLPGALDVLRAQSRLSRAR